MSQYQEVRDQGEHTLGVGCVGNGRHGAHLYQNVTRLLIASICVNVSHQGDEAGVGGPGVQRDIEAGQALAVTQDLEPDIRQ